MAYLHIKTSAGYKRLPIRGFASKVDLIFVGMKRLSTPSQQTCEVRMVALLLLVIAVGRGFPAGGNV